MTRVITAIILGAFVLAVVWFLPLQGVLALVFVAAAAGFVEYTRMFLTDPVERWSALVAGLAVCAAMIWLPHGEGMLLALPALALFLLSLVYMWRARDMNGLAERLGLAVMGVIYLGISFPFWGWLGGLSFGKELLLLALVPACLCDTFALIAGKTLGRHKLAPQVSPNKTVEGLIGALFGSFFGIFLMRYFLMPQLGIAETAIFALIIWVCSPMGDLIESMLKRSCGVKDSGTIVPGHGGVLDRLDALIFTGPAAYIYAKYVIGM